VLAAKAAEMPLIDFAFKTTLPISIVAIISMAIAHFFWQRYLDKKENVAHEMLDVNENHHRPAFYAILPFTPIIGVLIFDGKWGPELHIITILVLCMLLAAVLEFCAALTPKMSSAAWKRRIAAWLTRLPAW
jgi:DcuC family C4-dicarboxylate transporter